MIIINKSERINDMMLYLNDKNSFNLKDIMKRYNISKSTALRDIKSLEEIGMPVYSNLGRNGCYGVLQNKLLSPILFNLDEVFALYFSMLTLRAYESTPFHLSVERLKQKFENCLSPEKIELLRKTEKVFSLGAVIQNNHCEFLKDILKFAIEEKVCEVKYLKNGTEKTYFIQFFEVSATFGQWYTVGYNFERCNIQVLRCDKVLSVKDSTRYTPKLLADYIDAGDKIYKKNNAIEFEVIVSEKGKDIFQKENYPSMRLDLENGQYYIRGFFNEGEESFIARYLLGYGETIISIKPASLSRIIIDKIEQLQKHYFYSISVKE